MEYVSCPKYRKVVTSFVQKPVNKESADGTNQIRECPDFQLALRRNNGLVFKDQKSMLSDVLDNLILSQTIDGSFKVDTFDNAA